MKIGNNEQILLSILKKYPGLSDGQLKILFQYVSRKNIRIQRTMDGLREKGMVEKGKNTLSKSATSHLEFTPICNLSKQTISDIEQIRLGKQEKKILFILSKIEKSSFQFLTTTLGEKHENLFAAIQRLESHGMIFGYDSPIRHKNVRGRWFKPRHYEITDLGKIISATKLQDFHLGSEAEQILSQATAELNKVQTDFHGMLNTK